VIICEIIVHLLVIVQNKKKQNNWVLIVSVRLCGENVRSPYKLFGINCNCTLDTPVMFILVYRRPAGRTEIYSFRIETRNERQSFAHIL